MVYFNSIEKEPEDPIFGINQAFQEDPREKKVNLTVGAYKNEKGNSVLFKAVQQAEERIVQEKIIRNYLPINGDAQFLKLTGDLVFGSSIKRDLIASCQTLGGTGALRIGGECLARRLTNKIYVSTPTWSNHIGTFSLAGLEIAYYPYYDPKTHQLDFEKWIDAIGKMEPGSALLMQASCHNPTGIDPTKEQWQQVIEAVEKRGVIPFFDLAYQGMGDGLDEDAYPVRLCAEKGMEMFVAATHSKNFGLYGERVGHLSVICQDQDTKVNVESYLKKLVRGNFSNPPTHGTKIVTTILSDPVLRQVWMEELEVIRKRIQEMRAALSDGLSLPFLAKQKGMFSFTGLSEDVVLRLLKDKGIYLLKNGRINVAGLNHENLHDVIDAIQNEKTL